VRGRRPHITLIAGAVVGVVFLLAGIGGQASRADSPTPPVTAGLELWYEAGTEPDSDGQAVTTWTDKSGNGRDLSAGFPNQAPTFRANAVNGRAAIEFDGVNSLLKTYNSTFTIAQPDTFFIVYKSLDPNTSSPAFVFDSRDATTRQAFGKDAVSDARMYANVDFPFGNIVYPFPNFQIWSGTFNGTSSSLYQNGVQLGTGNAGASALNGFTVGGLNSTTQFGYSMSHSLVAEILYYDGSMSASDRQAVTDWLQSKYNVIPPPAAPSNSTPPSVSGTAQDGMTLTASAGAWDGTQPIAYAYQWKRCDEAGTSCAEITGATSTTYKLTSDDIGSTIEIRVTASNSVASTTVQSGPTPVVAAGPPANVTAPSVSGTPQEGATLAASDGTWSGTAPLAFTYQWEQCNAAGLNCVPSAGGNSPTYTLGIADIGFTIRVQVTATNTVGNASATSSQTATVVSSSSPPPPSTEPPVTDGLQLWFEADTQPYADGQAVPTWTDKSGFGRDLSAFFPNQAPIFRDNAINGRAAVEFDGSSSILKTYNSTFTISQPDTFFIVYKALDPDTSARAFVFDSRDSINREVFGRPSMDAIRMYANIDRDFPNVMYPFPNFQIWSGTFNGSSSSIYRNGSLFGIGDTGTATMGGFSLGGLSTDGPYGYDMSHSEVAEVLYYSGSLSLSDRLAVTQWLDQKYNVIGPPTAPGSVVVPTITGTARDGQTLTSSDGFWSGTEPLTYTFQWRRCDGSGSNCADIGGANASTYALTSADVGSTITVQVTATNSVGSASASAVVTPVVAPTLPVSTSAPTLSGIPREGSTLTTANGAWGGTPPFGYTYHWQQCDANGLNCANITTATGPSYVLQTADVGLTVRAEVTAANAAGTTDAASSPTPVIVSAASPAPPTLQPPLTDGLALWYEAGTEQYADGQSVGIWQDKSGNGRNLTAFDPSQAPVFHRNAVNGRAAVEFDGVRSLLKTYNSTFTLPQPTTFFIVYRSLDPDTSARAFVFDSRDSGSRQIFGRGAADNALIYGNLDVTASSIAYPFSGFQVWSGTYNGSNSSLFQNGAPLATGNAGGASETGFTLGGLSTSAQYGYDLSHTQVAEILYYTGSLSDADREDVTNWLDMKYGVIGPLTAPTNTTSPAISGTAIDGSTLSTTTGVWMGSRPLTYAYQWRRCDSGGLNCSDIGGATASSYTLTSADVGSTIAAVVTASNSVGFASATAPVTVAVAPSPPAITAAPVVTGPPRQNATLTTSNGTWTGTPPLAFTYQWQRCDTGGASCAPIAGANAQTYQLGTADVGSTIRAAVTATNVAGNATASSAQTLVVVASPGPVPSAQPPVTNGLELWYEADTEPYTDGQSVSTWTDKSGFGRNLTAFLASQDPVYHQNAVNGHAAIEFNGSTSLMKTYGSTFTIAQPDTFFIVYKALDAATPGHLAYVFDSTDSSTRQLFGLGPLGQTTIYANIDLHAPSTYPYPGYQIWSGTYSGATSTEWSNGVQVITGNAGASALSGLTVGALSTSGQYGYNYGHSLVAEILFYDGSMSDSDRAAVTAWLNQKYGAY